jgi:ABC-type proline/glycine betaine transport system permease subunit
VLARVELAQALSILIGGVRIAAVAIDRNRDTV